MPDDIIDNAIGGDGPGSAVNEQERRFNPVQILQLLHTGTATIQIHIVFLPDFLKVRKICDDRGPLAAKGQIDEIFYLCDSQLVGHPLELGGLTVIKTVQPLGQVVQLVQGNGFAGQLIQDSIKTVQLIHLAVLTERVADSQWLQQFYRVVVFLPGNGEWNRNLPIFRVLGAAQHRLDYIAHSEPPYPHP